MRGSDGGRRFEDAACRHEPAAPEAAPGPTARPRVRFEHVTLPGGIVGELGPCTLQPADLDLLRDRVLPQLRRGSVVLPAQPRYRLSGAMGATGGRLFVLRARHGEGRTVARIGIGWRDHGASLVWQECAADGELEPARPWVVDAMDAAGVETLNGHEISRLARWLPALARELAWAVVPAPETSGDRIPAPTMSPRSPGSAPSPVSIILATRRRRPLRR